ncbi:MAG: pseudouridine synthase, partial [Alphaproteobacteria bacterium]|nr:pseudouridine synthase [Alphaproteobacteria bacterium]
MRPYNPPPHVSHDILYQDDSYIVLNKPAGLLSVPGRLPENKDSLASRVQQTLPEARIVHRLDMDTSGIIALALTAEAHRHLSKQFEQKTTKKTYVALIYGAPEHKAGCVDLPLRCDWPNRPLQMVDHELGKSAQTDYEIISQQENICRVLLHPITGRSHQLRVHMKELGTPIIGDPFYATE